MKYIAKCHAYMDENGHILEYVISNSHQLVQKLFSAKYNTKYNTFNVRDSLGGSLIQLAVLLHSQKQLLYANIRTFRVCQFVII